MIADSNPDDLHEGASRSDYTPSRLVSSIPLIAVLAIALGFYVQTRDMKLGTLAEPGPAMWPMILILGLVGVSILGLSVNLTEGIERFNSGSLQVMAGIVGLCLFVVLFSHTGMILPGILFLTFWLRVLWRETWQLSVAIAAGSSLLGYFLFVGLLGVSFPPDLIAGLWGGR